MKLNRTPSLYDRKWRNEENENWDKLEKNSQSFIGATEDFKEFVKTFDGNRLIEKNYNLFNKKDIVAGSLVGSTGEVTNPDSGFYTTNFIEVIPGKRLQIKPNQGVTVIYDSNYQYVQQISAAQHPMILPPNARYIRNSMGANSIDGKYIYLGEEDLPYIEYGYSYTPSFNNLVREIVTQFDVPRYINLFDKSKVVKGNISPSTGEIVDSAFLTSDFIKVRPDDTLIVLESMGVSAFYDSEKNFIGQVIGGTAGEPFEVPSNAAYFRTSLGPSSLDEKMVYHGTERMSYYPFNQGPGAAEKENLKPMRILIIGNSYSVDTFTHLHDICKSAGINVVVGVAHESGGSLSDAMTKIRNNETIHSYYKWTNQTGYVRVANPLIDYAIEDEPWDIVFFQQMSFDSLDYSTFQPHLNDLKTHVKNTVSNPDVRFGINAIWSRASVSSTVGSVEEQIVQFNTITENYKTAMYDSDLEILIPTGTAIQNGRANEYLSQVGIELTRDNAHLDEPVGRYIAAMTVFYTLFGESAFGDVSFKTAGTNGYIIYLAKMVAKKAVDNPYKISEL